jgi:uncharacterized protein YggU (UPF0235/DUF167 family)
MADFADLAVPGASFAVRATPRARSAGVTRGADGVFAIRVTAPPEDGRATRAVQQALAEVLGVAPSRLTLLRGAASRDKLFRLD